MTQPNDRAVSIDAVRGFALLGILPMNIPFFALSGYVFFNPRIDGGFEGLDWFAWAVSHVLFDMKMMALFSMLFGAGVLLFIERHNAKQGEGGVQAQFIRLGWLFLFGMIHAYVIWEGDILVAYALCGTLAVALRKRSPKWLLVIGAALMLGAVVCWMGLGLLFGLMRAAHEQVAAIGDAADPATQEFAASWEATRMGFEPDEQALASERSAFLGSYSELFYGHRLLTTIKMQTVGFLTFSMWRIAGLMCIGMALYKLRFWHGEWAIRSYARLGSICAVLGLTLVGISVYRTSTLQPDFIRFFMVDIWFNYIGSVGVALALASTLIALTRAGALKPVTDRLASVGRMAFTNYISQSIICALVFYGYAGGLWGSLGRFELLGVVALIWAAQLIWSPIWLSRFRMGPLEWVWRSLCKWSFQPMRLRQRPQSSGR